jgi:hypothetical protein
MAKQNEISNRAMKKYVVPLLASYLLGLSMPLVSQAVVIPAPSNKGSLQLDGYAPLNAGAGPSTNDASSSGSNSENAPQDDLKPVTLGGESESSSEASTSSDGMLKTEVSKTGFAPHAENEQVLEEASVADTGKGKGKGKHKGKTAKNLVEQAKDVAVGPLPLLTSDNDDKKAADFQNTAEKEQLSDLWEACLQRSPDIQFVVQKLQPTTNQAHLSSVLTKLLSTAAFAGVGAVGMMSPNMSGYMMSSAGYSAISSVLGGQQRKADKAAKLSQEEQMMMLQIVRNTADKLVASFRDYKKFFVSLSRASNDLQDLQAMAAEARAGQDAAKQLEMDYTLRKAQRDIDQISDEVRRHRSNLLDLAGPDAIAKLDKQIIWEQTQVDQGQATQASSSADASASDSSSKTALSGSTPETPPASDASPATKTNETASESSPAAETASSAKANESAAESSPVAQTASSVKSTESTSKVDDASPSNKANETGGDASAVANTEPSAKSSDNTTKVDDTSAPKSETKTASNSSPQS